MVTNGVHDWRPEDLCVCGVLQGSIIGYVYLPIKKSNWMSGLLTIN